jgi:hypothetical protein
VVGGCRTCCLVLRRTIYKNPTRLETSPITLNPTLHHFPLQNLRAKNFLASGNLNTPCPSPALSPISSESLPLTPILLALLPRFRRRGPSLGLPVDSPEVMGDMVFFH